MRPRDLFEEIEALFKDERCNISSESDGALSSAINHIGAAPPIAGLSLHLFKSLNVEKCICHQNLVQTAQYVYFKSAAPRRIWQPTQYHM